jgi:hypothetical protein
VFELATDVHRELEIGRNGEPAYIYLLKLIGKTSDVSMWLTKVLRYSNPSVILIKLRLVNFSEWQADRSKQFMENLCVCSRFKWNTEGRRVIQARCGVGPGAKNNAKPIGHNTDSESASGETSELDRREWR